VVQVEVYVLEHVRHTSNQAVAIYMIDPEASSRRNRT
jgi:hypothetical protein